MLKQARIFVQGDVISVGFCAWSKIQSKFHGVTGWVKNVFDKPEIFGRSGGVELIIQGSPDNVAEMITTIKKGSPISRVDDVEIFFEDIREVYETFEIRKSRPFSH